MTYKAVRALREGNPGGTDPARARAVSLMGDNPSLSSRGRASPKSTSSWPVLCGVEGSVSLGPRCSSGSKSVRQCPSPSSPAVPIMAPWRPGGRPRASRNTGSSSSWARTLSSEVLDFLVAIRPPLLDGRSSCVAPGPRFALAMFKSPISCTTPNLTSQENQKRQNDGPQWKRPLNPSGNPPTAPIDSRGQISRGRWDHSSASA